MLAREGRLPHLLIACVGGGQQRHRPLSLRSSTTPKASAWSAWKRAAKVLAWVKSTRPGSRGGRLGVSSKAPKPSSSRTKTARSSSRTPSPPVWTTPPSAPNTATCATRAAPTTNPRHGRRGPRRLPRTFAQTEGIIPALRNRPRRRPRDQAWLPRCIRTKSSSSTFRAAGTRTCSRSPKCEDAPPLKLPQPETDRIPSPVQ